MSRGILSTRVKTTEDLASWVKDVVVRERLRYRPTWVQWLKNLLAFHGESTKYVTDDLKVVPRLTEAQKKFLTDVNCNFISPHVRTVAAKLQRGRPILECLPSTSDEVDVLAAKVGDKMLKGEWFQQDMDTLRIETAMWQSTIGNCFMHIFFDSSAGDFLGDGLSTGQIRTEVISPFKIIFEPNRNKIQDCRWAIIRQRLPIDQVAELYEGEFFKRTKKMLEIPKGASDPDEVADSYLEVVGTGRDKINDEEFCDVDLLYHLPTRWYPNGRMAVLVGSQVLYEGPYPYKFLNRLPIVHFREILSPWRLYGETQCSEVLKAQELYLQMRTMERDYHTENIKSYWLKHKNTRLKLKNLINPENKIIEYAGDIPPKREPGINIPGSFFQSIEMARGEIERAGLSDASHSIAPTGMTSGRALLALQEQDDARLGLTAQLNEVEYGTWGGIVLKMAKTFYDEPRKYSAVGDALTGAVFFFEKANLGKTSDVRCVAGSALPMNKMAKQEMVKEWLQMGILGNTPEEAVVRARKMMEVGLTDDIFDDDAMDQQVAEKENIWMVTGAKQVLGSGIADPMELQQALAGIVMPVSPIDNHALHIKVLLRRAKAPGIRDNEPILNVLVQHYNLHVQQMAMGGMQPPVDPNQPQPPQQPPEEGQERPVEREEPENQEEPVKKLQEPSTKVRDQQISSKDISKGATSDVG